MADNIRIDPQDLVELDLTDEDLQALDDLVLHEEEFFLMLDVLSDYFNQVVEGGQDE